MHGLFSCRCKMFSHFLMSTIALIIFETLLSAADIQARSSEKCSQKYFYKVTVAGGELSESDIISSVKVRSEIQCSHECLKVYECIAFNYRSPENDSENCQLSNKTRDEIITNGGAWIFYQDVNTLKNESRFEKSQSDNNMNLLVKENCAELYNSGVRDDGVYTIDPDGLGSFQVRCDMTTGSGGLTVIQRRLDGSVDFYLGWSQYKHGFGDLNGEFWLGLDKIYRLTQSGLKVLRINLMDFNNAQVHAEYSTFEISDEATQYTLNVAGFSGDAGDSLDYHKGHKFSTKDKDHTSGNCAVHRKGAWWYDSCAWSNLNGQYLGPNQDQWHGIQWRFWKNSNECMKRADMKLRPRQ